MSNRITLGFHRIGIVAAVIVFILLLIAAGIFGNSGVQGVSFDALLECLLIAVVVYCLFRLVGWAVNGFSGNNSPGELAVTDPATVAEGNIQYNNDRQVSRLLWLGIILIPIVFVWFLFRRGYPTSTRVWGVLYLLLNIWAVSHFSDRHDVAVVHPRIDSGYTPAEQQQQPAYSDSNQDTSRNTNSDGRPDSTKLAEFTAQEIEQAYADNTVAADDQFKNKWLIISGVAGEISTDVLDQVYISLKTDDFDFNAPQVYFIDSERSKLSRIKKGQHIRAECIGGGDIVKTPMLKECTLLDMP